MTTTPEVAMHPDLLYVERVRARELRQEAERHRLAGSPSATGALEERLGWVLVRAGLRLLERHAPAPY
ncbi:hypothetical protein ABZW11_42625 [Nonomuraea sp. NPDC004580]|uniref:hypothetical protein n=1 Tax=Nonomuraea sp. NPDC004580 TaxID=3154552 RepID=UPI0033B555F3